MWQGLVGPCHFCLWDFLMRVLDGVPDWGGVKKYESWLLGPGLDLILFIVQLGATGPPRYTLVLQIYNYITNFQLMCFCYMLFVGKMMPVLLSIRCFNDGDWVYRSLVAE